MKRVAVIITVYNRKEQTLQCLKALNKQTTHTNRQNIEINIYLTNDGCTDGTPEAIKEDFPYVHIIDGDGNLFWNRGMYVAWQEAAKSNYDYYLWLNDDTHLYYDAVERLITVSEEKYNQSVIIGSCCSATNKNIITYGGRDKEGRLIEDVERTTKCTIFNGNIVLIPRFVFAKVGFNDYYYNHALGDFDYSLMVKKAGLNSYVAKGVYGTCELHSSKPKWSDSSIRFSERWKAFYSTGGNGANPFEFFHFRNKHYGILAALATFISNHLHVLFPKFWEK